MTEVVTALSHQWESSVAATLAQVHGVSVVRRCADVSELVSVVEAGVGELAVVSGDLRGLDLSVVRRLRDHGVRVVGLHPAADDAAERRLRQLSITQVLPAEASAAEFALVLGRDRRDPDGRPPPADDGAGRPTMGDATRRRPRGERTGRPAWRPRPHPRPQARPQATTTGGPDSHPGRRGAAAGPAAGGAGARPALPDARRSPPPSPRSWRTGASTVLLVDADTYGGCVAQSLGLLDEAPGIAAACRAADQGTLDVAGLARLAPIVAGRLRVLTGMPKAERWTEVRAAPLERVLELSRSLVEVVVVDCGFCLEDDEELSYDTAAPRRNEATLTSLACADEVVAVGGADPVALQRLVRALQELGTVPLPGAGRRRQPGPAGSGRVPTRRRVSPTPSGASPGSRRCASCPTSPPCSTRACWPAAPVVEQAPGSGVRSAVADLADALVPAGPGRQVAARSFWGRVARRSAEGGRGQWPEVRWPRSGGEQDRQPGQGVDDHDDHERDLADDGRPSVEHCDGPLVGGEHPEQVAGDDADRLDRRDEGRLDEPDGRGEPARCRAGPTPGPTGLRAGPR